MKKIGIALLWIIGLLSAALCGLVILKGGSFETRWISVGNVKPRIVLAIVSLTAAYLLPTGGKPRRLRVANLVLLFFSLGLCGVAAELMLRGYLQNTQGFNSIQQLHNPNPVGNLHTRSEHPLLVITQFSTDKRLIYELKPKVDREFGHKILRTNAQGFRADREFPLEKPAGTKRIIGVGDSGMWGWSLDQNQGYLEILEREWNQNPEGPRVEVINLAVPGYNTFQEYVALEQKGLPLKPDLVIIGWCENDIQLPFFMYTRKNHWKQKGSYTYNLLFRRARFLEMVTPEVLKQSEIPKDTVDPEVIAHSGADGIRKTLLSFRALADLHGFQVVLFGPLKDDIKALCAETGIPTLNSYDLAPENPPEECGVFFMHPAACGHELLGKFLASRLRDSGWL
jgi:hypothetical protein